MRQQGAEIDVVFAAFQRGQVFGEAFPAPVQALIQAGTGQILDPFHQRHDLILRVLFDGREADAAIAHDNGGDAVPGRGSEVRIPHGLPIIMGMNVDEARCDGQAGGVDFLGASAGDFSDGGDLAILDGDIGDVGGAAIAVHHGSAANDDIEFIGHCYVLSRTLVENAGASVG